MPGCDGGKRGQGCEDPGGPCEGGRRSVSVRLVPDRSEDGTYVLGGEKCFPGDWRSFRYVVIPLFRLVQRVGLSFALDRTNLHGQARCRL